MRTLLLSILTLMLSPTTWGANTPPTSAPTTIAALAATQDFGSTDAELINLMSDEIFQGFRLKLKDLRSNYTTPDEFNKHMIVYVSPGNVGCPDAGTTSLPDTEEFAVAKIVVSSFSRAPDTLDEQFTYFGCNENLIFTESLQRKGSNLTPTSFQDVLNVQRQFVRTANETSRIYSISDPVNGVLISSSSMATTRGTSTSIQFSGRDVFTITSEAISPEHSEIHLTLQNFAMRWQIGASSFTIRYTGGLQEFYISSKLGAKTHYRDPNQVHEMSELAFENIFIKSFTGLIDVTATQAMAAYAALLPTTTTATPPLGTNQRLIDELTKYYGYLVSNVNILTVKNALIQYINDIKSGALTIEDNRK